MKARFENGIYRDCKWCRGAGCLACPAEAKKEYERQFPNGPEPILVIPNGDFDRLAISEATGGPGMIEAHGEMGVLASAIFEHMKARRRD